MVNSREYKFLKSVAEVTFVDAPIKVEVLPAKSGADTDASLGETAHLPVAPGGLLGDRSAEGGEAAVV